MKSIYKIPASCKIGSIATSKGIFKINENLSQADRKYLHEAGFMKFDIELDIEVNEQSEQKSEKGKTTSLNSKDNE